MGPTNSASRSRLLDPFPHPEPRASGPGVTVYLFGSGSYGLAGDPFHPAHPSAIALRLFRRADAAARLPTHECLDQCRFQGMVGDDYQSPALGQQSDRSFQTLLKIFEFAVDLDPKGLKCAGGGMDPSPPSTRSL